MTTRYVITDSVPLNGGDEALLRTLIGAIMTRDSTASITVLAKDVERCRLQCPDLTFDCDPAFFNASPQDDNAHQRISALFQSAEIIISSPGGFLNDYYRIDGRLQSLELAIESGTPVVLFGQSIGPIWKEESKTALARTLNRCRAICVRDDQSIECLHECGVDSDRIHRTTDVAFLLHHRTPQRSLGRNPGAPTRSIGMCFRRWPLHDHAMHDQIALNAAQLAAQLLDADTDRHITFLSTCQGIEGYKDDSEFAEHIVGQLSAAQRERCTIDSQRHNPQELITRFGRFDALIGMRLHACILAMLGGCPALGVGYEFKTRGIFTDLNLDDFQFDYDQPLDHWLQQAEQFLCRIEEIRLALPAALNDASARVERSLIHVQPNPDAQSTSTDSNLELA